MTTTSRAGLLALGLLLAAGTAPAEERPVRMLFAGSSSIYWNDLPEAVARVVDGKVAGQPGRATSAKLVGRSGDGIHVYLRPGFDRYQYGVPEGKTFLDVVRRDRSDLVVLMAVAQFIVGDEGEEHAKALETYCRVIRESGGEPVYYEMGWREDEASERGRKRILESARKNGVRLYVPCSTAWARVRRERPDLDLQHPRDRVHPGDVGHFLNLACFYAALTGESPEGKLPRKVPVWHHWSKEEREERRETLEAAHARFKPSAYQARLPDWMQRYASAGLVAELDEKTARYLERVAGETVKSVNSKLRSSAAGPDGGGTP